MSWFSIKSRFDKQNPLTFKVQSSDGVTVYTLSAYPVKNGIVRFSCNCPAGAENMACKHRLSLIKGDTKNLISNNLEEINHLIKIYKNSQTEKIIEIVQKLQDMSDDINKEIKKTKKILSRSLNGENVEIS